VSRPRPVFAGDVVHLQRRIRDGRFFLVPRPEVVRLVQFAYAVSGERHGLAIHALCVMSNHVHVIATDREGRHPEFTAYAHRLIALGIKSMHGIEGAVWQEGGASVQRLVGAIAITEALAYLRVNPVAAGCVRHERDYVAVFGADEETPLSEVSWRVPRPACFGNASCLPEEAVFAISAPRALVEELGDASAAEAVREAVARHRDEAKRVRAAQGLGFFGMKRVLAADVWTRPSSSPRRAAITPTFKGAVPEAIAEARKALRAFRRAYAEAMIAFRAGRRDVEFPPGTYLMCRRLGCAADHWISA
jgi:putative transposase